MTEQLPRHHHHHLPPSLSPLSPPPLPPSSSPPSSSSSPRLSRREFVRVCAMGMGLLACGSFLEWIPSRPATAAPILQHKRLVVVFLRGGNDGLNTIIPHTKNRYYDRRPAISVKPANAYPLNGVPDYSITSALPKLRDRFNAGEIAIINQVGYPVPNLSHFVSEDIWSFGVRGSFGPLGIPASGWIARYADRYGTSPLSIVSIGQGLTKDFLGGATPGLVCDKLSAFQFAVAGNHVNNHYLRLDFAHQMLSVGAQQTPVRQQIHEAKLQSYDLSAHVQQAVQSFSTPIPYPNSAISSRLRDIAILIKGGFDTQIFYTGVGGYDTHSAQSNTHNQLLLTLDNALDAFVQDLKNMGAWNDTCIAIVSEFGRRNNENGSAGTDHGHGNCMFLIGGSVLGGIYGPSIENADLDKSYLDCHIDFRTVLKQIMQRHLGKDPAPIFPETIPVPTTPGNLIA